MKTMKLHYRQYPIANLSITGAGDNFRQRRRMFYHTLDTVSMTIQRTQKRFGKHSLKFHGVHGSSVLARRFKRMQHGVVVTLNCVYWQQLVLFDKSNTVIQQHSVSIGMEYVILKRQMLRLINLSNEFIYIKRLNKKLKAKYELHDSIFANKQKKVI